MTKKEKMVIVRGIVEGVEFPERDEVLEMIDKEIDQLGKKRAQSAKKQEENKVLSEVVYEAMAELGKPATVTEIFKVIANEEGITSTSKVTVLLKILEKDNRVVRTREGKKAPLYSIAD